MCEKCKQEKSTQELFNEITEKLIVPLKDNEIICPTCKGLRLIYKQTNDKGYVINCTDCYNGKLYKFGVNTRDFSRVRFRSGYMT